MSLGGKGARGTRGAGMPRSPLSRRGCRLACRGGHGPCGHHGPRAPAVATPELRLSRRPRRHHPLLHVGSLPCCCPPGAAERGGRSAGEAETQTWGQKRHRVLQRVGKGEAATGTVSVHADCPGVRAHQERRASCGVSRSGGAEGRRGRACSPLHAVRPGPRVWAGSERR